jgi:putative hemolysin
MDQASTGAQRAQSSAYPADPDRIPAFDVADAAYSARFARTSADLEAIQRLRYEVFNLELGEGLEDSHADGLDRDPFDAQCHHLMVIHSPSETVIGTYRLQTSEMARSGLGFYSNGEFELEAWPAAVRDAACEVGRACIAADHRHRRVLLLLWRGLGAYVLHNRKRYFFGCCSLTSQDPVDAARMAEYLRQRGRIHPELDLAPRPECDCREYEVSSKGWEDVEVPTLMGTYLRYGAWICGRPAIDREFKTIDFLALLDLDEMDPEKILRQFEVDLRDRQ